MNLDKFFHLLILWSWTNYLNFVCLNFLTEDTEIIIAPISELRKNGWGNSHKVCKHGVWCIHSNKQMLAVTLLTIITAIAIKMW